MVPVDLDLRHKLHSMSSTANSCLRMHVLDMERRCQCFIVLLKAVVVPFVTKRKCWLVASGPQLADVGAKGIKNIQQVAWRGWQRREAEGGLDGLLQTAHNFWRLPCSQATST